MKRYSAKLLFQFRVDLGEDTGKRRLCEENIFVIEARSAKSALAKAKRTGKRAEINYENAEGNMVYFEFIGVMDLLCLGSGCEANEVWYELRERLSPMERRDVFIPPENELNAMQFDF